MEQQVDHARDLHDQAAVLMVADADTLGPLIQRWKADPGSTYRSWFLWDERLKKLSVHTARPSRCGARDRRRHLRQRVPRLIARSVVGSIAEQQQIFKGADHAFLWKPKLRIPDIYENADNQRAFARLLQSCDCCDTAEVVIDAIRRIDAVAIKGLGPAVANLLYFTSTRRWSCRSTPRS